VAVCSAKKKKGICAWVSGRPMLAACSACLNSCGDTSPGMVQCQKRPNVKQKRPKKRPTQALELLWEHTSPGMAQCPVETSCEAKET